MIVVGGGSAGAGTGSVGAGGRRGGAGAGTEHCSNEIVLKIVDYTYKMVMREFTNMTRTVLTISAALRVWQACDS